MVARANKVVVEEMKPKERPSCLHINLKKDPMPQSHLKLGAKMKLIVEGKVTSVNQDEFGKNMTIDIISLKHGPHSKTQGDDAKEDDEDYA